MIRTPKEIREYLLEMEKSLAACLTGSQTPIDMNLHYMRMGSLKTVEDILKYMEGNEEKHGIT